MKKALSTFLAIMYLMSGVGFGSVHHFCHHADKMISQDENHCCSAEEITKYPTDLRKSEESGASSCCEVMDTSVPAIGCGTAVPGDCCEIQHKYNQLDGSPLQLNIDVNQAIEKRSEQYHFPQDQQNIDSFNLTTFINRQPHVNIPLLI